MKISWEANAPEMLEIFKEILKKMKEFLRSEFEKKVSVEDRNGGETYLHFAAFLGHVEAIKVLILDDAEVSAVNKDKNTALHYTAENGHVDVAKTLIQNGADVNAVDYRKSTALHLAA